MSGNHPQKNQGNKSQRSIVAVETTWSGPLPPPQTLAQFDQVYPGSAKMIMDSFHNQTIHRQELEKIAVNSNVAKERRGQKYGLAIGIIGILCGTTCILLGHDTAGATIIGADLLSLVSVFVLGKAKQTKDLKKKDNIKTTS